MHPISRPEPHKIPLYCAYRMGQNLLLVLQLHPIETVRHLFQDYRRHGVSQGRVNTQGPFEVTATQCSKWAE
jgi:hypothetical protein